MKFKSAQKYFRAALIYGVVLPLFLVTACGGEKSDYASEINYRSATKSDVYDGTGEVFKVATSGNTELTYNLDLGSNTKTVYYIFTTYISCLHRREWRSL